MFERSQIDCATWTSSGVVARWRASLAYVIGCSAREIAQRLEILTRLCRDLGVSPERLVEQCRTGPAGLERRNYYLEAADQAGAKIVVASFLIHNGINTFGELVCLPSTANSVVREQGAQWQRARLEGDGR
jgi:hypothetical protein